MRSSFSVVGSTEGPVMNKAAFPLEGLCVPGSSLEALQHIKNNIPVRIPEANTLCDGLLSRLQQVHDVVVELDQDDPSKVAYNNVLVRFLRLQIQRPVLVRLAKSDTTLRVLQELHQRLDGIFERFSVEDTGNWESQWGDGCAQQQQELTRLAARPPFLLANEVGNGKKLREALQTLRGAVNKDREGGEMRDLRQRTLDRVANAKGLMNLNVFEWFIAIEDVDYEDEALGLPGTFAQARRATWLNEGKRQDVVIKTLHYVTAEDDNEEDAFLKQLALWYNLPPHENILKLHGGNHERSHPFFVCEDAHNGNLLEFFEIDEHKKFFWPVFLGVANGLKFLHDNNIVHRSLKGNNILIGDGNVAKIGDFGFSQVRSLSMNLSGTGAQATSDAIRWKPRELVQGSPSKGYFFASDIYSLGLCMLEAISGEIPFGMEDDEVIIADILAGKLPPRPDAASDTAWDLICHLCAADYRNRPAIAEVISTLTSLMEKETPSSSPPAA